VDGYVTYRIFEEPKFEIVPTYQKQDRQKVLLHCYDITEEEDPVEDNPRSRR
jgi:hypothetical protein